MKKCSHRNRGYIYYNSKRKELFTIHVYGGEHPNERMKSPIGYWCIDCGALYPDIFMNWNLPEREIKKCGPKK